MTERTNKQRTSSSSFSSFSFPCRKTSNENLVVLWRWSLNNEDPICSSTFSHWRWRRSRWEVFNWYLWKNPSWRISSRQRSCLTSSEIRTDTDWKETQSGCSTSSFGLLLSSLWNLRYLQTRTTNGTSTWSFSFQRFTCRKSRSNCVFFLWQKEKKQQFFSPSADHKDFR